MSEDEVTARADSAPTAPLFAAPLKNRCRIQRLLGRGGFGVVYLAADEALHGRQVVIKMLRDAASDPWITAKFAEEVRALSRIDHPGVVIPLDSGTTADGRPFLVIQFVDGTPLADALPREGMPLDVAAEVLRQIGQALGAAHDKGVWHRDLKPANIMIERGDAGAVRVRLIDFGISTIREAAQASEVLSRVAGSLPYMAPEQLRGRVSAASDVFAVGVIAYEMLTGRKPFVASDPVALVTLQEEGVRLPPSALRPEIPRAAERLILGALSFRADARPADVRAFANELAASLTTAPIDPRPRGRRSIVAAAAVLVAAMAAGGVWQAVRTRSTTDISCSVMTVPLRGGQPSGRPSLTPAGAALRTSDGFFLILRASRAGHLYVFSDTPSDGTLNVLFPSPLMYGGSSGLTANEQKQIPERSWFMFDDKPSTSTLRFVWAEHPIPRLEAAQRWVNERDRGSVNSADERSALRQYLNALSPAAKPAAVTLGEDTRTVGASAAAWAFTDHQKPQRQGARMTRRARARLAVAALFALMPAAATTLWAQDEARQIWDSYFAVSRPPGPAQTPKPAVEAPRYKSAGAKTPPVDRTKQGSVLGVTIWRIESSKASDQARLLVQEPGASRNYTPHRLEAGELLHEGDRVRLAIEAASSGYLYVVDQELRADQTLGPPYLIFPTRRTRNGDNQVRGGRLIDIPAQTDSVNVFTIRRRGPTDAGEELTLLLSPAPLTDVVIPSDAEPVPAALLASWSTRFPAATQRYELQGGRGRTWTIAEQQAGAEGARLLTPTDPAPQTVFFFPTALNQPVLARLRLQIAQAAPSR